ncbi:MAG: hypothetical protein KKC66_03825, partial [Candidatus Omnitrophica bacterium]|nr:hypothetical protein [Candidatus Omnitrophota bacterium]
PEEIRLEGRGNYASTIGGVIVETRDGQRILFPKDRVADLINKEHLGDLLHEVTEIGLIEDGMEVGQAHEIAMDVRSRFLQGLGIGIDRYRLDDLDDDDMALLKYEVARVTVLDMVRNAIEQDTYLRRVFGRRLETLMERINNAPSGQQQVILNGLTMLIPHYTWAMNDYVNRPELEGQRDEMIRQVQEYMLPNLIDSLDRMSVRLADGDLVPGAVTLNVSENNDITPEVDVDTLGRKAKVAYLPMKGDPWHWGHIWMVWRLLADGYDVVIPMEDNGDPDRKPDLTALSIREVDSQFLYEAFSPFLEPMKFQREIRTLLEVDGDTMTAVLIFKNREISSMVEITYIAGYDHLYDVKAWVEGKQKEGKAMPTEAKRFPDVPYKLFLVSKRLAEVGIPIKINVRFNRRGEDSDDTPEQQENRRVVMQEVTNIRIIESYAEMVRAGVRQRIEAGGDQEFWNAVGEWVDQWEATETARIREQCTATQLAFLEEIYEEGKNTLLGGAVNEMIDNWLERFGPATTWKEAEGADNVLKAWFDDLAEMQREFGLFDATEGEGQELTGQFTHKVEDVHMVIEVVDQEIDVSSSRIRGKKRGDKAFLLGIPREVRDSIEALRWYPSCQTPETNQKDKKIAARVIADLIDIKSLLDERGQIGEEELIDRITGQTGASETREKFWAQFAEIVDVELLLQELGRRLAEGELDSMLLYEGAEFDAAVKTIGNKLADAHGPALHAVDGYLVKWLVRDEMFEKLLPGVAPEVHERQAVDLVDKLRFLVKERALQIVEEARTPTPLNRRMTDSDQNIDMLGQAARQTLTKSPARQQVDSMDQIMVVPAAQVIANKTGFGQWISQQPSNNAVVIIAYDDDEYTGVKEFEDIAYIKVLGKDIGKGTGEEYKEEYRLKLVEMFGSYGKDSLFGGFVLGAPAKLDKYKTVASEIASGV